MVTISISGYFEISERNSLIVTGYIKEIPDEAKFYNKLPKPIESDYKMTSRDTYQELRLRGYYYQWVPLFILFIYYWLYLFSQSKYTNIADNSIWDDLS